MGVLDLDNPVACRLGRYQNAEPLSRFLSSSRPCESLDQIRRGRRRAMLAGQGRLREVASEDVRARGGCRGLDVCLAQAVDG